MITYPIQFEAKSQATSGTDSLWNIQSGSYDLTCAIPQEFEGPGLGFSPEDLFAQALTNCFVATFKVYAQTSKLDFKNLEAQSKLTVDLNENKKPVMKVFHLNVIIHGASNVDKAKLLADKAFKSGFILNSVKTDLHFQVSFES